LALNPALELFSPDDLPVDSTHFVPFLNRARTEREQGRDMAARIALGSYLASRLVDRCLTLSDAADDLEGFGWQHDSTRKFLADLPATEPEVAHLVGIIDSVESDPGHRDAVLRMALIAYAYYLEHEARLEEALEVLGLSARTYRADIPPVDLGTLALFVARLNRLLARWDRANRAYAVAERAGHEVRDLSTVTMARIGRANVHRGQGNLPVARAALEQIIAESDSPELRDAQGRALSELAVVFALQGMTHESIIAKYHALRSVRDSLFRFRILGDLGISLRELGAYDTARQCFDMVLASEPSMIIRANTCIEMMEMESANGNRLAFERYRQEAKAFEDRMPPSMAIDYRYRVAIGFARFGQEAKSRATLREALGLAEASRLNEWYFRIDRVLRNLALCPDEMASSAADAAEVSPAVAQVSAGLKEFASSPFG
jgi:tetratricopeptide (TPR) repeat protein